MRALLGFVGECFSTRNLEALRPAILPGLRELVPCDVATYNEVEFAAGRMIAFDDPEGTMLEDAPELFVRYGEQNPLVRFFQAGADGRPRKWSDFIDRRELHATDLYRVLYEPMGVEHQMAFTLPSAPELLIGLALNRGRRDFSERDRTLLNLVRPHLVQAYDSAREYEELDRRLGALERDMDEAGRGLVLLSPRGEVEFVSDAARRALGAGALPPEVGDWLEAQRRAPITLDAVSRAPLFLEGPRGRVVVRLLPARTRDERDSLIVEASAEALTSEALRGLGLSARQADVLRLVAMGESTPAVAAELGISPRTVEKHLQEVFKRLGVHNRAAAGATAWAGVRAATARPG